MAEQAQIIEINKGGRPKRYTDRYVSKLAKDLVAWISQTGKEETEHLFLKEFAVINGFSAQRISELAKDYPRFAEAYYIAKDYQEVKICKGMIRKGNNPAGWIFISKNVINFRDRQEDADKTLNEDEIGLLKKQAQTLKRANV